MANSKKLYNLNQPSNPWIYSVKLFLHLQYIDIRYKQIPSIIFNYMKTTSNSFVLTDTTPWEQVGDGVRRKIMGYNEQVMTVVVAFEKGAEGAAHQHPHTQSTWVASGSFEFCVDGCTQVVKQGDGILIAPDLVHGCICLEAGILIDTFTPMRADFLPK